MVQPKRQKPRPRDAPSGNGWPRPSRGAHPDSAAPDTRGPDTHACDTHVPDHVPDTEARILNAADTVFTRRGTDGARMQEIADEAGVNKALLHYYFRSKAALSQAVFERAAAGILSAIFPLLDSDLALEDKIDRFVEAYTEQLSRRPYLPGYILSELAHRPDRITSVMSSVPGGTPRRALRRLGQQIEVGVKAGTIAPMTPEQLLVTLLGACIFPFAAQPMLAAVLGFGPHGFERFVQQRRKELPLFLKRAIRP